jgi:hypothetical protein
MRTISWRNAMPERLTKGEPMASDDRSDKAETGMVPEVANLGIMRPPFIYLRAIALGLLLHFVWPVRLVSPAMSLPLGGIAVLVAVALFLSAVLTRFPSDYLPYKASVRRWL